ncbi:MAG: hypothetical protein ACYC26_15610 [Phycisphaerales bacterium]
MLLRAFITILLAMPLTYLHLFLSHEAHYLNWRPLTLLFKHRWSIVPPIHWPSGLVLWLAFLFDSPAQSIQPFQAIAMLFAIIASFLASIYAGFIAGWVITALLWRDRPWSWQIHRHPRNLLFLLAAWLWLPIPGVLDFWPICTIDRVPTNSVPHMPSSPLHHP